MKILLLEDNPDDAELLVLELRRTGFEPACRRVEVTPELTCQRAQVRALHQGPGALVAAQGGDERGLLGGPGVRVDADAGAVLNGLPHPPCGGHDPLGRLPAYPGDSPERFCASREDRADCVETGVPDGGERDPPLDELPEPVYRHRA